MFLAGLLSAPTAAATGSVASLARGYVALYGPQTVEVQYDDCDAPVIRRVPSEVTSFLNMPLPDCRATLINEQGKQLILCEGRGTIPFAFRPVRQLLIQSGGTQPCRTTITQEYR